MDKKLRLKLNGNRGVVGVLRGFDQFLNLVLDECVDDSTSDKEPLGMRIHTRDLDSHMGFGSSRRIWIHTQDL